MGSPERASCETAISAEYTWGGNDLQLNSWLGSFVALGVYQIQDGIAAEGRMEWLSR